MKIAIISRVYNEEAMIQDFILHYLPFATGGFWFFNDGSIDNTLDEIQKFKTSNIISSLRTSAIDSHAAQNEQRRVIIEHAIKHLNENDYFMLLDVDEFIDFTINPLMITSDAVNFKLFDLYITPEDKELEWTEREYIGPEYRNIIMMVRVGAYRTLENDRTIIHSGNIVEGGYVKHIGKGFSEAYWERKCEHYATPGMPGKYQSKWEARKGKAIHTSSDFGRDLIPWDIKLKFKTKWIEIE